MTNPASPGAALPAGADGAALVRWLRRSGIIAHLAADMPRHLLVEVIDGLLAAPVLATVAPCTRVQSLAAITALCERSGRHMLVGASAVHSAAAAREEVAAGAAWLLAPYYDREVARVSQTLGAVYVPGVLSVAEARDAAAQGCTLLCQMNAELFDPSQLHHLMEALPECTFLVAGDLPPDEAAGFAATGAAALLVDIAAPTAAAWRQADLISDLRERLAAWSGALA